MELKIQTWLLDIRQCIDEIFLFVGDGRDFLSYKEDLKTKKAVERNLEIIGEAVNRILKEKPNFQIENSKYISEVQEIELFIAMIILLMKLFGQL